MAEQMNKIIEKLRFQLSSYRNDYVVTSYPFAAEVLALEGHKVVNAGGYYKIYR